MGGILLAEVFHPGFSPTPYWWDEVVPDRRDGSAPEGDWDVVVVGGGYAGLSTALELSRNGSSVAVLDSGALANGASTRNSGAVSVRFDLPKVMRLIRGREDLAPLARDAVASIDFTEGLIRREELACDYAVRGSFLGAAVPAHYEILARRAESLRKVFGISAFVVGRADQSGEIASDYYHGGMVVERTGQLHPSRYHKGLADACRRAGASLFPDNEVSRIGRVGTRRELVTSKGVRLTAGEVVIATNGYTGELTPGLRRGVISVSSHILATEAMAEEVAAALLPRRRMVSDSKRLLCYFRLAPDGRRLIFGGRPTMTDVEPPVAARLLHREMVARFPQLAGLRVTHAWKGQTAFTFDALPHMGRADGLHYCLGCNGNGVAMMTYLGYQTARKLLSGVEPACAFDQRPLPTRVYHRGAAWFLPLAGMLFGLGDWIDRKPWRWA